MVLSPIRLENRLTALDRSPGLPKQAKHPLDIADGGTAGVGFVQVVVDDGCEHEDRQAAISRQDASLGKARGG